MAIEAKPSAGMAAAPAACRIRPATSRLRVGARAQTSEPAARPSSPREKVRRRL